MIVKAWKTIRLAPALIGLGLPLAAIGLTRYRWWVVAAFLLLGIAALASRKRRPRLYNGIVAVYLIACVALVIRTLEIVDSISPSAWWRILLTALLLIGLFAGSAIGIKRSPKLQAVLKKGWAQIGWDLLLFLATILILRLGQYQLWQNPSLFTGMMVAFPLLHFRPRPVVLVIFSLCCSFAVFEWHGFMTTKNISRIPENPPAGIRVDMLYHGNPGALQGARFYTPGQCPETAGSYYMGEMLRTYRLKPDGGEIELVTPDAKSNNEAVCAVVELCADRIVITGSDEARFIRFSDLLTGEKLKDVPLRGQPTFLVLSPDKKHLYVSIINPGGLVRVDLATRKIDRELMRFTQIDPDFSGVNNLILVGDRVVGAFSSYFTLDNRQGEVFSVNLELDDYRTLFPFYGSWGVVAPADDGHVFFKVYSRRGLYRVALDGSGAQRIAAVDAGYHYLAHLPEPGVIVINHWTTGDMMALCVANPEKRFHLDFGGMGRPMTVVGDRVTTAVPAGYATVTFSRDLCR